MASLRSRFRSITRTRRYQRSHCFPSRAAVVFGLRGLFLALQSAEEPDRVRTLLEDVENVRRAKMYEGMGSAAQEVQQAVKVRK